MASSRTRSHTHSRPHLDRHTDFPTNISLLSVNLSVINRKSHLCPIQYNDKKKKKKIIEASILCVLIRIQPVCFHTLSWLKLSIDVKILAALIFYDTRVYTHSPRSNVVVAFFFRVAVTIGK